MELREMLEAMSADYGCESGEIVMQTKIYNLQMAGMFPFKIIVTEEEQNDKLVVTVFRREFQPIGVNKFRIEDRVQQSAICPKE